MRKNAEMIKLFNYLNDHGYSADHTHRTFASGEAEQINVYHLETGEKLWDVVANPLSMGWDGNIITSKLELMGKDRDPIGYLTAEEIITSLKIMEGLGVRMDV